jgi:hypothetical protein
MLATAQGFRQETESGGSKRQPRSLTVDEFRMFVDYLEEPHFPAQVA